MFAMLPRWCTRARRAFGARISTYVSDPLPLDVPDVDVDDDEEATAVEDCESDCAGCWWASGGVGGCTITLAGDAGVGLGKVTCVESGDRAGEVDAAGGVRAGERVLELEARRGMCGSASPALLACREK